MNKDKESDSFEEIYKECETRAVEEMGEMPLLHDNFVLKNMCSHFWNHQERKYEKKLDAANKLLLFNVNELDFQSQEAVRFKSELGAANEIIEKLKSGISAELKRCGGTVPILKQTLKEVEEMKQYTGEE